MQNSSARILKIIFAFILAFLAGLGIWKLPWYPPVSIDLQEQIGKELTLKIQKSDGEIVTQKITPTATESRFTFYAAKLITLETSTPDGTRFLFESNHQTTAVSLTQNIVNFPETHSHRNIHAVQESIVLVTVLLFFILWSLFENFYPLKFSPKHVLMGLGHLIFLGLIFQGSFPGFFGYDSFEALKGATSYQHSNFSGDFYISLVMVFFQIFSESWVLTLLNMLALFFCLTSFSNLAFKWGTLKFYFLALLIFFAYPVNLALSVYTVRDTAASWLMAYVLIKFYDLCLSKDTSLKSNLNFGIAIVCCCLLRKEAFYLILPGLFALIFFRYKFLLKSFTIIALLTIAVVQATQIHGAKQMDDDYYNTTLLINPLSYILKHKYPEGLPPEVDQKLGLYFKNNYLIEFQEDFNIPPFHKGGLNYGASHEDYLQFRNSSLEIMIQNWGLYLKNRLSVAGYLFGLKQDASYFASDDYFKHPPQVPELFDTIKQQVLAGPYNRPHWGNQFIWKAFDLTHSGKHIFISYLIPILLLIISFIYYPRSFLFNAMCAMLVSRSVLVILTAPAGYFKYLYPLWVFAPFCLLLLVAEKRHKLTNSGVPFTTL